MDFKLTQDNVIWRFQSCYTGNWVDPNFPGIVIASRGSECQ